MKIFEVSEPTIKLFRGDSSKIIDFDVDRTDDRALFGLGIYLTDNHTIATDYTLKSSEHVIFGNGRDSRGREYDFQSDRELTVGYLKHLIDNELGWYDKMSEINGVWREKLHADPAYRGTTRDETENRYRQGYRAELTKTLQSYLAKAKKLYRQRRPNMRIVNDVKGNYVFVKADRDGYVTTFDIPVSFINRTIHAEKPLSDEMLAIVRQVFIEGTSDKPTNPDRIMDMRDKDYSNFLSFDQYVDNFKKNGTLYSWSDMEIGGKGENPSFDELRNGTNYGTSLFYNIAIQKKFIALCQKHGYVGFEYEGGKRINGTATRGGGRETHRCFVLWDGKQLGQWRTTVDKVTDAEITSEIEKSIRATTIYSLRNI